MLRKKIIVTILFAWNASVTFGQDSNIQLSLNAPAYGVKIKNNFPNGSGDFARAFMLSNQDGTDDFFGLGVYGKIVDGISSCGYGYIGKSYYGSAMAFIPNGNVGIGTTNPTEKLSVKGNIRAMEIKVENANWPDYVFAKTYQLPTLLETEKHIKEKGHLPGIPSAEEVKSNGIDLGEMNAKLLQKIEELTLHLIEQDKNQKALREEVRGMKIKLNHLRSKK